ncbi:MAG: response regulator [Acidobacteria bacterium]|nr:response regulator [Acidobacteriota bacterium]MCL5288524.1 response regulator [Acidobacteriota bacterium]
MDQNRKPVILVVDDELPLRYLYRETLLLHGYEVVLATNKEEAIQVISTQEVDGIVCDIQLPGNGVKMYEYLLAEYPELRGRFIFVTGSVEKKEFVERTHNSTPCLLKPFPMRQLVEAMKAALTG